MEENAILIPRKGYVIVEEDGKQVYKKTSETIEEEALKLENAELRSQLATLEGTMNDLMMNILPSIATTT